MSGWLDRIESLLTEREGSAWSGSVEDLLYEGEEVEREVDLETNRIVVTGHRVLAFTPEADGENFRAVDRPNVSDVRRGYDGDGSLLRRGARTGVYAVLLVAVGLAVDFESILPTTSISAGEGAGRVGIGGMLGIMNRFLSLIGRIDDLMVTFGALAFVLTAVMLGVYLLTRERVLVIDVAGDEADVLVPAPGELVDDAVADLEGALFGVGGDADAPDPDREGFKSDDPL